MATQRLAGIDFIRVMGFIAVATLHCFGNKDLFELVPFYVHNIMKFAVPFFSL